jgi:hypothetical protein
MAAASLMSSTRRAKASRALSEKSKMSKCNCCLSPGCRPSMNMGHSSAGAPPPSGLAACARGEPTHWQPRAHRSKRTESEAQLGRTARKRYCSTCEGLVWQAHNRAKRSSTAPTGALPLFANTLCALLDCLAEGDSLCEE